MIVPREFLHATTATLRREYLSHRVNRFLYCHIALLILTGVIANLASPRDQVNGVAWFTLYAVLYAISLSSLLIGLSSGQAEHDEASFLHTQPTGVTPWVTGKAVGIASIVLVSAVLLVIPSLFAEGSARVLLAVSAGAGGVCVVVALLGLTIGLAIQDPVRALITAVAFWFLLLFGADIVLFLAAGTAVAQSNQSVWVLPLMVSPFDTYRIFVMFLVEGAAFDTMGTSPLVSWWIAHSGMWQAISLCAWAVVLYFAALVAATRRPS